MSSTTETVIKNAATELYQQLKHSIQGSAAEVRDLAKRISEAFELELLSGNPQAEENMRARTLALMELARIEAVQTQKEVIIASVVTGLRIVRSVLISL